MNRIIPVATIALGLLLAGTTGLFAQPVSPEDAAYGAADYATYCATCHGRDGKGNGPKAGRGNKPADLTVLSQNNGGQFPFIRVYNLIEHGGETRQHKRDGMPAWGELFAGENSPMNPETALDTKINDLIEYLRSIQVKNKPPSQTK